VATEGQPGKSPKGLVEPMSFWTQPINLRWLVPLNGDSGVPSLSLSLHSYARRDSRSGSELPPFDPCTARMALVRRPGVGHALQAYLLRGNYTLTVVEL
jgi:hypothetical protein